MARPGHPVIVENRFGRGRCIYSAVPVEAVDADTHATLFATLVRSLLDGAPTFDAAAHPNVWVTGFAQPDRHRVLLWVLRYERRPPGGTTTARIRYRPGRNARVRAVREVPGDQPLAFAVAEDGAVEFCIDALEVFAAVVIDHSPPAATVRWG